MKHTHTNFAHYCYLMMLFIIISSVQAALLFPILFSTKRKIAVAHSNNNLTNSTSSPKGHRFSHMTKTTLHSLKAL